MLLQLFAAVCEVVYQNFVLLEYPIIIICHPFQM